MLGQGKWKSWDMGGILQAAKTLQLIILLFIFFFFWNSKELEKNEVESWLMVA